jgi:hypothetical protein
MARHANAPRANRRGAAGEHDERSVPGNDTTPVSSSHRPISPPADAFNCLASTTEMARAGSTLPAVGGSYSVGTSQRRCPSCHIARPRGEFVPVKPDPSTLGISRRQCPACGHCGLTVTFARVGGAA